ncbi:MAG: biopolymer transporter ExbD [Burkholderiaceae bacterium]
MNFKKGTHREEPEINLIPLIDLFLVIIIFLMVTTTYSKFAELQITLPTADAEQAPTRPAEIDVAVTQEGRYTVDGRQVAARDAAGLTEAIRASAATRKDPVIVINADAQATHQSVVNVMEAARTAQIAQITFATQTAQSK